MGEPGTADRISPTPSQSCLNSQGPLPNRLGEQEPWAIKYGPGAQAQPRLRQWVRFQHEADLGSGSSDAIYWLGGSKPISSL